MNTTLFPQYRNPPFKPPTRVRSPNLQRSPKRKRSEDTTAYTPPLRIDTAAAASDSSVSGTSSPGMKVVQQLNDLKIDHAELKKQRRSLTPRKRIKRTPVSSSPEVPIEIKASSNGGAHDAVDETSLHSSEIGETPVCRHGDRGDPGIGNNDGGSPHQISTHSTNDGERSYRATSCGKSTSLPLHTSDSIFTNRSVSPLPTQEDLTSDQAAFTWREDEITGHEIDTCADDDGEGINGIGFRPTPAIAYARKQRRRQQVNEWKAREAKEARQRRFERRKGGARGSSGEMPVSKGLLDGETFKRSVRFEGVD